MFRVKNLGEKVLLSVGIFLLTIGTLGIIDSCYAKLLPGEEEEVTEIHHCEDNLSQTMYDSILNFNYQIRVQHPLVVTAQAILETGNFTSKVFKENNNLYGMTLAKSRPTLAIGVRNGYAVYRTWQESAIDYALWQSSFARNLSEEDYYLILKRLYAEDKEYVNKVKNVLK
jgi:uncharacterized FlgJ-related protein